MERPMEKRVCENCGSPVGPERRSDAKYCTDVCGNRARHKRHYRAHPDAFREKRLKDNSVHTKRILSRVKCRAKKFGLPFDLGEEDIVIPEFCPVLGLTLQRSTGRGNWKDSSPSLDRIVPKLGYVKGNVRIISARANLLKSNATIEELEKVLADLRRIV
jgi:hypothetical protein